MKRRFLFALLAIVLTAGCEGTTLPERREILGSWAAGAPGNVTIRMTVAETARSVDGAGAWVSPTDEHAFRVFGAIARDEVSLIFDFAGTENVNFQGYFQDADAIVGTLTGNGLREVAVTFERDRLSR